jgi:uncharacterized alkaline shock family protein YloU
MKKDTSLESIGASTGNIPPAPNHDNLGKVEVSPEAIANIAAQAIMERAYGVVGLAARRLRGGKAEMLKPDNYREGIQIRYNGDEIILDLYVIMEYPIRVSEAAHTVMTTVKSEVEKHLGRPLGEVNVNVQGLRLPPDMLPKPKRSRISKKETVEQ